VSRWLGLEPILVGNLVKALLVLGATVGLAVTDAQTNAIVAVVTALMVLLAAFHKVQRNAVTPVEKVADLLGKPVDEVNALLKGIK
jgi:hypothetical protein